MKRTLQALALALPLLAAAQAGQISGTVVSVQGGEPLPSVELSLSPVQVNEDSERSRGPRGPRSNAGPSARTSLDGRFVFDAVDPGEYILGASKAGYEGGGRTARRISLADSAPSASVTVELNRSPALEGRILDGDGDPLPGARVELRAWTMSEGRRTLRGVRSAQTDDRGEYRLYNLTPGQYLVYLHATGLGMRQGGVLYETSGVYYPQAASPAQASKLVLSWGAELKGVDLVAAPAGATLVSGTLLREDGGPCDECSVSILDANGLSAAVTRVADGGRFAVQGLLPAEYTFAARGGGLALQKVYLPERRPLELSLRLSPGQTVSGAVSWRNPETGKEVQLDRASVRLLPADPTLAGQSLGARLQADGAFELAGVPQGVYSVRVFGLPEDGYIGRVLLGGAELADAQLQVSGEGPVSGLQLVAAFDGGAVQGRAIDRDGESPAPPDGIVILVPERSATPSGRQQIAAYRGGDVSFEFRGVPPGEYLIFAAPRDSAWDWSDPAMLSEMRRRAARVEVRKGETVDAAAPFLQGP